MISILNAVYKNISKHTSFNYKSNIYNISPNGRYVQGLKIIRLLMQRRGTNHFYKNLESGCLNTIHTLPPYWTMFPVTNSNDESWFSRYQKGIWLFINTPLASLWIDLEASKTRWLLSDKTLLQNLNSTILKPVFHTLYCPNRKVMTWKVKMVVTFTLTCYSTCSG